MNFTPAKSLEETEEKQLPLRFAFRKSVPFSTEYRNEFPQQPLASGNVEPTKFVFVRFADEKMSLRIPVNVRAEKFAPVRFAEEKLVFATVARRKSTPVRFAELKLAFVRSRPANDAPLNFAAPNVTPRRFAPAKITPGNSPPR